MSEFKRTRIAALLLGSAFLFGCQSTQVFHWGQYEWSLHKSFSEPGSEPPVERMQALEKDILDAKTAELPVAPGIYAQLGYLAVMAGQKSKAKQAFEKEKALFPESTHFMDSLIAKLASKEKTGS